MSDPEHLYRTLVQEGLVPRGFSDAFDNFYKVVDTAAQRTYRKLSKIDNVSAAVSLHRAQKQHNESPRSIHPCFSVPANPTSSPSAFQEQARTSTLHRAHCQERRRGSRTWSLDRLTREDVALLSHAHGPLTLDSTRQQGLAWWWTASQYTSEQGSWNSQVSHFRLFNFRSRFPIFS